MGYAKDEMSGHGFRSMASTLLNEQGWNRDAIERQFAHAERDSVRAAYNYAEFMSERNKMMQSWADYLDGIKAGAKTYVICPDMTIDIATLPDDQLQLKQMLVDFQARFDKETGILLEQIGLLRS